MCLWEIDLMRFSPTVCLVSITIDLCVSVLTPGMVSWPAWEGDSAAGWRLYIWIQIWLMSATTSSARPETLAVAGMRLPRGCHGCPRPSGRQLIGLEVLAWCRPVAR